MQDPVVVTRIRSASELQLGIWGRLSREGDLFLSPDWLGVAEDNPRCAASYSVASAGTVVVAALPCYASAGLPGSVYQPELHFPELIPTIPPDASRMGVLIGGCAGQRTALALDRDVAVRPDPLTALVEDALRQAAEHRAGYAFALFGTADTWGLLRATGLPMTSRLALTADAHLLARGGSFDDYLAGFKAKRRISIRAEMRSLGEAGLRIEVRKGTGFAAGTAAGELAAMANQLQRKYGLAPSQRATEADLRRQEARLGARAIMFLCRQGDDTVGFALGYVGDDGWLSMRSAGFDYPRLRGAYEYFNTVIYHPLLHCYEQGYAGLRLGAGSHEAKAMRGAVLSPLVHVALGSSGGIPAGDGAGRGAAAWWRQQSERYPHAFGPEWEPWLGHRRPDSG
jgi:uncharacterized protein